MHICCHIFSAAGLPVGTRLGAALKIFPWLTPRGEACFKSRLYAPRRLAARAANGRIIPFDDINQLLASVFSSSAGHVFIGAAGIAVRAIAPFLRHKSLDPPVIVLDAGVRFAISLLSGHWGGGNALARHVAILMDALPVISTASDCLPEANGLSLDLLIRDAGLKILNWRQMPFFQARILEGQKIFLYDPWHYLPCAPCFINLDSYPQSRDVAAVAVDWRLLPRFENILFAAPPVLHIGIGFRKGVTVDELQSGLHEFCHTAGLEPQSVAALATVHEKGPQLEKLAMLEHAACNIYKAGQLAAVETPNPSILCGKRFAQKPFSVCESAALLSAGPDSRLVAPKMALRGNMTFAAALRRPPKESTDPIINAVQKYE